MLGDKRYGLTVNLLATKVLPSLTPVVVSPNLKLEEVKLNQQLIAYFIAFHEHIRNNPKCFTFVDVCLQAIC